MALSSAGDYATFLNQTLWFLEKTLGIDLVDYVIKNSDGETQTIGYNGKFIDDFMRIAKAPTGGFTADGATDYSGAYDSGADDVRTALDAYVSYKRTREAVGTSVVGTPSTTNNPTFSTGH